MLFSGKEGGTTIFLPSSCYHLSHILSHQMTWYFVSYRHRCCEKETVFLTSFLLDFQWNLTQMTTLLSLETLTSGHPKYSTTVIFLLPPSLEPLLNSLQSSLLLSSTSEKCFSMLEILWGSVLGPLCAESSLSPSDFIHKHSFAYHPGTADSSPDFRFMQSTAPSDSST